MCDFCNEIPTMDEYEKKYPHDWDEVDALVRLEDGAVYLYVPCVGDSFYSRPVIECHYCPNCGRKLD